jgi:hypothetical protein
MRCPQWTGRPSLGSSTSQIALKRSLRIGTISIAASRLALLGGGLLTNEAVLTESGLFITNKLWTRILRGYRFEKLGLRLGVGMREGRQRPVPEMLLLHRLCYHCHLIGGEVLKLQSCSKL